MTDPSMTDPSPLPVPTRIALGQRVRGAVLMTLGLCALAGAWLAPPLALLVASVTLIAAGLIEFLEIFQSREDTTARSAYVSGGLSILAGILLLDEPKLVLVSLRGFLAVAFLLDGGQRLLSHFPPHRHEKGWRQFLLGLVNILLALMLLFGWPLAGMVLMMVIVGVRLLSSGATLLVGPVTLPTLPPEEKRRHPDWRLALEEDDAFASLQEQYRQQEMARRAIDRRWFWAFLFTFFAIHVGRMSVPWNLVGFFGPGVAVLGDVVFAFLLAFGVLLPVRLAWRRLSRPLERLTWRRVLARQRDGRSLGWLHWLHDYWLLPRYGFARQMQQAKRSPRAAVRWGLRVGLPLTAVLIALHPVWGFNWFFNTENWAAGIWNRWAETRADTWREAMIAAVEARYSNHPTRERLFEVEPEGIQGNADFSFLVIGDPGEGDASQHCLRDQYLFLGQRPDMKFLVISSDVIYPSGEMKDYEPNFYLPFKGFTKPIYAIPGNHDWYDALEAFSANFMEEDAARACMLARVETDGRLTTTTEGRIEGYLAEAKRLKQLFGVRTGAQRGPFFEIQTERFALIAADTGVLAQVDPRQWDWLRQALERARGKFTFVLLGHPFYAGGRYHAKDNAEFEKIHELLRQYDVQVVMAGDTHYLEYYRDTRAGKTMHHFVNGGGGAYISIGTPLDWPREPDVPDCAYFPSKQDVIDKLDRETDWMKRPLWWWVKYLHGWPSNPEFFAGAFNFNRAPYFQSFMEIRVEPSQNRVRLIPHDANGPLRWRDFERLGRVMPEGKTPDDGVEWVIDMPAGQGGKSP